MTTEISRQKVQKHSPLSTPALISLPLLTFNLVSNLFCSQAIDLI